MKTSETASNPAMVKVNSQPIVVWYNLDDTFLDVAKAIASYRGISVDRVKISYGTSDGKTHSDDAAKDFAKKTLNEMDVPRQSSMSVTILKSVAGSES